MLLLNAYSRRPLPLKQRLLACNLSGSLAAADVSLTAAAGSLVAAPGSLTVAAGTLIAAVSLVTAAAGSLTAAADTLHSESVTRH